MLTKSMWLREEYQEKETTQFRVTEVEITRSAGTILTDR